MFYRHSIDTDFSLVEVNYNFTNGLAGLKAGVSQNSTSDREKISETLKHIYSELESVIRTHPEFETSFKPIHLNTTLPMIRKMIDFSKEANVGPMAGVAGAVSEAVTDVLKKKHSRCFFENGGDISLISDKTTHLAIFPGWNGFDHTIHFKLPQGSWGIASSSGKYGRSYSLGQADMVTIVDRSPVKADIFATAIANQINDSVNPAELISQFSFLNAIAVIHNGIFYYKGEFELC